MRGYSAEPAWAQLAVIVALACVAGACSSRSTASEWSVEGPIYAIDGSVWVVGDRLVTIAPDARVVGSPAIGSVASVRGTRNEHGSPIGESVEIAPASQPASPPTATAAPLPTAAPQVPATAPPRAPVTAPPPAPPPAAQPANQPKPQPAPEQDDDKKERHGPAAKPGDDHNRGGKPKGR